MSSRFVPCVASKTKRQIEDEAEAFLARHMPERLVVPGKTDVIEAFELLGDVYDLKPGVAELSDGVEGMTWPDGRVQVSEETYSRALQGHGRARFTIVHETYHGLYHRDQIKRVLIDEGELVLFRRSDIPVMVDPEWQANIFAGALLMPRAMVRQVIKEASGSCEITDMIYYFGVSPAAAKVRLRKLRHDGYLQSSRRYIQDVF